MDIPRIDKEIFPGLMMPPFHYACFTTFTGYSEDRSYTVHNGFQVMLGLRGVLHFELEEDKRQIDHTAGSVFVLSPGIRHRWYSDHDAVCENFMFFCNGFTAADSALGEVFNITRPEIVWQFDLDPADYSFYVDRFRDLIRYHDRFNDNIMHGLLYAFCGLICRRATRLYRSIGDREQHPALTRALEMINRDYRGEISLERLSRHSGLGPSRLSELFQLRFGMSPIRYINELKIGKARQLLTYSDMNITEISDYLGFRSIHYFSRFFKCHTGVTPSSLLTSRS